MRKDAVVHLPMSEYCYAASKKRIVFRLRAARGDLTACTLYYGDTACRKTPIDFFPRRWASSSRTNGTTGGR